MKTIHAVRLLAALSCATLLAACGGSDRSYTSRTTTSTAPVASTATVVPGSTVTVTPPSTTTTYVNPSSTTTYVTPAPSTTYVTPAPGPYSTTTTQERTTVTR